MAAEFEFAHGYPCPVHYLAKRVADENQLFTQHAYKRSSAAVMILGGCVFGWEGGGSTPLCTHPACQGVGADEEGHTDTTPPHPPPPQRGR